MDYKFSEKVAGLQASAIREILKFTSQPGVISFAAGSPAQEAFPTEKIADISAEILKNDPVLALQYSVSEGYPALRELLKKRMQLKGCFNPDIDDLIITSGAQQANELSCKVLCNEGDTLICESPSFIGSLNAFSILWRLVPASCRQNQDSAQGQGQQQRDPLFPHVVLLVYVWFFAVLKTRGVSALAGVSRLFFTPSTRGNVKQNRRISKRRSGCQAPVPDNLQLCRQFLPVEGPVLRAEHGVHKGAAQGGHQQAEHDPGIVLGGLPEARDVHHVPKPVQEPLPGPGGEELLDVQSLVVPHEQHAPLHHRVQEDILGRHAVKAVQLGLEHVPAVVPQDPAVLLLHVVPHFLQEVGEEVVLPCKILVKAPSGDARPADNLINGDVHEAGSGEFLPSGVEKATPLFLRQPEEGLCTHMYPSQ